MPEEPLQQREFTDLYRATIAPLRRYLARLLGNPADAQEVAHDAYIRVYQRPENEARERPPAALLYTIARNLAINRLRRRSVSPFTHEAANLDTAASSAPGVAEQVISQQERSLLESAIADLPTGCRSVLVLRHVELLSHREIGERLGIAISTVEKQHARALRLLRSSLPAELLRARNKGAPEANTEVQS